MRIKKIGIKNFRLLKNVSLLLEEETTVIVGRNNSGKTSLAELFRRLSDKSLSFRLEDFSLSAHEGFWQAFVLNQQGGEDDDVRAKLPFIEVSLTVGYDPLAPYGPLGEFIIDLNQESNEALVVVRYQLKDGDIDAFLGDIAIDEDADEEKRKEQLFRAIRDRLQKHYIGDLRAVDPNDPANQKPLGMASLRALLSCRFINAQRGLDDITQRDKAVLGKILEDLFSTATSEWADPEDRAIAQKLRDDVEGTREGINAAFNNQLFELLPAFREFGYPGLSEPGLCTETTLDVQRLLTNHTTVHYAGVNGINLPEAYNGLGARNLIYILLRLLEFFKTFMAEQAAPSVQFVFIEEPEVHLHPQMQEVFISKLNEIADIFARHHGRGLSWPVQFVVTTHSSHVANRASFDSMRYFIVPGQAPGNARATNVKDLRDGLGGTLEEDRAFLHKYMTLTRCDLLFADKAVLIEGTTERLMLPPMIAKVEAEHPDDPGLSSQYVSVVEVGGAYAHLFFPLLDFLELRTLVVTDLDSTKKNGDNKPTKCRVSLATHTSNACVYRWFGNPDISPAELIAKSPDDKICGIRRLAYQVPEADAAPCGRSFEDAFMLANPRLFELSDGYEEQEAWDQAQLVKKSDFALDYAIANTEWTVPRYIAEGLRWLAEGSRGPIPAPLSAAVATPSPTTSSEAAEARTGGNP